MQPKEYPNVSRSGFERGRRKVKKRRMQPKGYPNVSRSGFKGDDERGRKEKERRRNQGETRKDVVSVHDAAAMRSAAAMAAMSRRGSRDSRRT